MPVSVKDVLYRAKVILQDAAAVRWPLPELAMWVLDGAKEIALNQPSATAVTVTMDLVAGTRQSIDATLYQSMMRITRNLDAGGAGSRAVTPTTREVLDAQVENWHDSDKVPFRALVRHVIIDVMDPMTFYVYPGNDGTGHVECVMSKIPVMSGVPADPDNMDDYETVTVPLISVWLSALVDYVLYRAFTKDSQYAGAEQRAAAHYGQFTAALNARMQANQVANPNMAATQPQST